MRAEMIANGAPQGSAFGPGLAWTPVEVFTGEQRLSCEMKLRGRVRERLLDTEPTIRVQNATTIASDPSMPQLHAVPEGLLHRQHIITCTLVSGEPHDPDAPAMTGRHALFEGAGWSVSGTAQFAAGIGPEQHMDQLAGGKFALLHDVTVYVNWGGAPVSWNLPEAYVNLEIARGIYLR
ncbi:MAG TPA: hypothetical protein VIO84_08760 [Candidatus Dormibacteraeota bacterium]|jgi:hypothetical protein